MAESNWWTSWGSSATTLVGLGLGVVGTWLGVSNARRARLEHGWKVTEREGHAERSNHCTTWRTVLADGSTTAIMVDGKFLEWALWGQANGYFKVEQLEGNKLELTASASPNPYTSGEEPGSL